MSKEITYTRIGDYLLPDIGLSEPPKELTEPLGRYARMRKTFLKEHRTITYNSMLLSETLFPHLRETDETANARMEQVMDVLTEKNPTPDKAIDPIGWTATRNAWWAQAEEVILYELIYQ